MEKRGLRGKKNGKGAEDGPIKTGKNLEKKIRVPEEKLLLLSPSPFLLPAKEKTWQSL